jgi:lysophospholipase L1-like esterase
MSLRTRLQRLGPDTVEEGCPACRDRRGRIVWLTAALLILALLPPPGKLQREEKPLSQAWDYATAMKKVAAKFHGNPGVVLHVGDSITYSNPYGQWARNGKGKTKADKAILAWMHAGTDNDLDGWWLARFDHPAEGRSYTACGGLRADELLAGGKQGLPPLTDLLDKYQPQVVVLMLGTNDATAQRPVDAYRIDISRAIERMLKRGIVCILSTIPPHPHRPDTAKAYNVALRKLARKREIPLIDFEAEILKRRPGDAWNGTLLQKNDVHPTVGVNGVSTASEPTAENLKNSGYLLRGWLSVRKIAEVKNAVLEELPGSSTPAKKPTVTSAARRSSA